MGQRTFDEQPAQHDRRLFKRIAAFALAAVVLLALAAAAGVGYLRSRDSATVVSPREAVDSFRRDPRVDGGRDVTTALRPPAGVYVYATTGFEKVDALGGARHDYPTETTITIRHTACGLEKRWEVFAERWDERTSCVTQAGEEHRSYRTRHEFFGQADVRAFEYSPGSLLLPADAPLGATWGIEASADDGRFSGEGVVVGTATLRVEGSEVATVHVRVTSRSEGSARGDSVREMWLRATDGLLVREAARTTSFTESPLGTVAYVEEFEIELRSLTPRT